MYEFPQSSAVDCAKSAADRSGIPQTVFRTPETGGWAHTNPFSRALFRAEVFYTVLPAQYFQ